MRLIPLVIVVLWLTLFTWGSIATYSFLKVVYSDNGNCTGMLLVADQKHDLLFCKGLENLISAPTCISVLILESAFVLSFLKLLYKGSIWVILLGSYPPVSDNIKSFYFFKLFLFACTTDLLKRLIKCLFLVN